jgi:hypothetical protein
MTEQFTSLAACSKTSVVYELLTSQLDGDQNRNLGQS